MAAFKCEKHGVLSGMERVKWNQGTLGGRWCIHCVNEMMDKHCGKLIEVEEDEEKQVCNFMKQLLR